MRHLILLLSLNFFGSPDAKAEITLDFMKDRSARRISAEAPIFKQVNSRPGANGYYVAQGDFDLVVKIPKEGIIRLNANFISFQEKNDAVFSLHMQSRIMPMEEAHQAALTISNAMNLQAERIAEWYQQAATPKGSSSCLLMSRSYPRVAIEIRDSVNTVYPYMMTAAISWNDFLGGETAVPPPFPQPLTLSLDPPSGKVYDPAEMWGTPEQRKEQERFGNEWVQKNPDAARKMVINTYGKDHPKVKELEAMLAGNQPVPRAKPPAPVIQVVSTTSYLWLWMVIGGILILVLLVRFKRHS